MSDHAATDIEALRRVLTLHGDAAIRTLNRVAAALEAAKADRDRYLDALEETLRQFCLWETSRSDEMGLDPEGTLVQIENVARAALWGTPGA